MEIQDKICKEFEDICNQGRLPVEYEYLMFKLQKIALPSTVNTVLRKRYIIEYNVRNVNKSTKKMILNWSKK